MLYATLNWIVENMLNTMNLVNFSGGIPSLVKVAGCLLIGQGVKNGMSLTALFSGGRTELLKSGHVFYHLLLTVQEGKLYMNI